jgi:DNA-binding response OmpR family regulator
MTDSFAPKARVLVVDDAPEFRYVLWPLLHKEGFFVATAEDGTAAVEKMETEDYDVVVLDVMMPDMDGFEACRRIREFSDAYVLMLTSRDSEADKLEGFAAGADDYLTKPFSGAELVARLRALLARAPLR